MIIQGKIKNHQNQTKIIEERENQVKAQAQMKKIMIQK
jgi:hypothetical protein